MTSIWVGAGSNSGPVAALRAAVAALRRVFGPVLCSSVVRSAAVGEPAPDYLNLVVGFTSERGVAAVKGELEVIEAAAGRTRSDPRAALCPLDLDLLLVGERVDAEWRLPHPDVLRRAFVLAPLAEVAPLLAHPVTGETFASAWARLAPPGAAPIKVGRLEALE